MTYKAMGNFVKLSQGLATNIGTNHLVSEEKNEEFIYPLLRIADMTDNEFTKYISKDVNPSVVANEDDIIYTRTGQIGLAFRGYKGVVHNNSFIVSLLSEELDKDYLFTLLKSDLVREQALKLAKNSVQPDLTHDMFKSIEIPIPQKSIQKKIAKIHGSITEKIAKNNKIRAELEAITKTLYNYWFLQFEFPNEEGKPYKSFKGKMMWDEDMKKEIPVGWSVETLANNRISSVIKPGVNYFSKKNYLATGNVNKEEITDGDWITYENREGRANMQPLKNSVWFAKMKNSVKHISITENAEWFIEKYILSTGFLGLSCTAESFPYIHSFISEKSFEVIKDFLAHGATQEAVNNKDLESVKIIVPDNKILAMYAQQVAPILKMKMSLLKENQELASLRDFLLPLLMNGQVGFKEKDEKTGEN